ncbi:putative ABC transporter permease [Candidatus Saccharibacteria bacterium]|nr:putative ABC transporter permease [Candidatus Saccharibacteria bacterium]
MDKKSTRQHSSKKGVAAMKLSDQDKLHNLPFKKLFFVFLFGCVFGCIYETVLTFFMYLIGEGSIVIVSRSGLLYGPFNPVYGVGAALMVFFLARKDYKWWQIVLYGAIIGGVFELLVGLGQEVFTGTSSWNYSDQPLNILGKTSVFIMLVWGLICLFFIKLIYPVISKYYERMPDNTRDVVYKIMLIFIIFDCLISFSAVVRMNLRHHGQPAITPFGKFLDSVYTDERIHRSYTNMEEV